jgi:predicted RNase H-like HicB family nuclease
MSTQKDKLPLMFSLQIEANDDGYLVSAPGIQGAFAEGDTIEAALFNCIDVIKLISAYRRERGESIEGDRVEITVDKPLTIALPIGI